MVRPWVGREPDDDVRVPALLSNEEAVLNALKALDGSVCDRHKDRRDVFGHPRAHPVSGVLRGLVRAQLLEFALRDSIRICVEQSVHQCSLHGAGQPISTVIVYSSIMIQNRPESLRSSRSSRGPKFLVAQVLTGMLGWLTGTLNRESVGRGFEPRPPHFTGDFSRSILLSHSLFTAFSDGSIE